MVLLLMATHVLVGKSGKAVGIEGSRYGDEQETLKAKLFYIFIVFLLCAKHCLRPFT